MKNILIGVTLLNLLIFISCGGDSEEDMKMDCTNSTLEISLEGTINADCGIDGSLEVSAEGGDGNINFSIDGGPEQSSGIFSVSAGTYSTTVTDEMGCTAAIEVTVGAEPSTITISTVTATESGCGSTMGTVEVSATGGVGGLTYQLDAGVFQSSNIFDGLSPNSYVVTVKDGKDCDASRSVQVLTGVNLTSDIMPIISANCQTDNAACHSSSAPRVDLGVSANIISKASDIRSRTQSGNMPKDGTLSQNEKDLIACWVDDGAIDN